MNKLKLMYVRWKNTSKWRNRRICKKRAVEDIFYGIKSTNTFPGWLHNNLKIYRSLKKKPESILLKRMFMENHLMLFSLKGRWKFAKQVYKMERDRWGI